jgi:hypothetical protein
MLFWPLPHLLLIGATHPADLEASLSCARSQFARLLLCATIRGAPLSTQHTDVRMGSHAAHWTYLRSSADLPSGMEATGSAFAMLQSHNAVLRSCNAHNPASLLSIMLC